MSELRDEMCRTMEALRGTVIDGRTISSVPKWVTGAFADVLLPIVTEHLAKSFREGYEAGSEQAEDDVQRRIAQARAETARQAAKAITDSRLPRVETTYEKGLNDGLDHAIDILLGTDGEPGEQCIASDASPGFIAPGQPGEQSNGEDGDE